MDLFSIFFGYVPYKDIDDGKDRPALVLEINIQKDFVKCLKITDQEHSKNYKKYLVISDWESCNLTKPSIICLDEYYKIKINHFIGRLSDSDFKNFYDLYLNTDIKESIQQTSFLSEEEMKSIICTMIDKYDASEEETFDELQFITPYISRDLVSRLYKMCNNNYVEENISQNEFKEIWEELENLEE